MEGCRQLEKGSEKPVRRIGDCQMRFSSGPRKISADSFCRHSRHFISCVERILTGCLLSQPVISWFACIKRESERDCQEEKQTARRTQRQVRQEFLRSKAASFPSQELRRLQFFYIYHLVLFSVIIFFILQFDS